ncbi:hypothetical protein ACIQUQ_31530 [Streptomyces sp. NPDC101118]|uniref:hypothetical protein n=1 Tax=Streptomyces sp. NPDC101118 TaxID=3366109 RepID=UPI003826DE9D
MRGGHAMADDQRDDDAAEALSAALRPAAPLDERAAAQAVAAFRAARDEGLHEGARAPRTRRRDDWRPAAERRRWRSLRAALAALVASVTLGGVAVAAGGLPSPFGPAPSRTPEPRRSTPAVPPPSDASTPPPAIVPPEASAAVPETAGPEGPERTPPGTAESHAALCHAYEKVKDSGRALDSAAWQRLVTAAGGEAGIPSYCERLTAPDHGKPTPPDVRDGWDRRPPHPTTARNDPDRP